MVERKSQNPARSVGFVGLTAAGDGGFGVGAAPAADVVRGPAPPGGLVAVSGFGAGVAVVGALGRIVGSTRAGTTRSSAAPGAVSCSAAAEFADAAADPP